MLWKNSKELFDSVEFLRSLGLEWPLGMSLGGPCRVGTVPVDDFIYVWGGAVFENFFILLNLHTSKF